MAKITKRQPLREGQKVTVGAVSGPGWARLVINPEPFKEGNESLVWVDLLPKEVRGLVSVLRLEVGEASVTGAVNQASGAQSAFQAPLVNNNGTSKKALMDQLLAVYEAGRAMEKALAEASPHGRDYQTAPPGAYQTARKQHEDRAKRVSSVLKEIEDIALQVQDQGRD
jgi:hypothetical protein